MKEALPAPGLGARLTGRRHRPGAPKLLAGFRIIGVQESADSGFGARNADNDFAVNRERRGGDVVTVLVLIDLDIPTDNSGLGVQRDEVAVYGSDEHGVIEHS